MKLYVDIAVSFPKDIIVQEDEGEFMICASLSNSSITKANLSISTLMVDDQDTIVDNQSATGKKQYDNTTKV